MLALKECSPNKSELETPPIGKFERLHSMLVNFIVFFPLRQAHSNPGKSVELSRLQIARIEPKR